MVCVVCMVSQDVHELLMTLVGRLDDELELKLDHSIQHATVTPTPTPTLASSGSTTPSSTHASCEGQEPATAESALAWPRPARIPSVVGDVLRGELTFTKQCHECGNVRCALCHPACIDGVAHVPPRVTNSHLCLLSSFCRKPGHVRAHSNYSTRGFHVRAHVVCFACTVHLFVASPRL